MPSSLFTNADIPSTIQLATAPVFFLAGIGAFLNVIAGRLARVVDRARTLEALLPDARGGERRRYIDELKTLDRRMTFASQAIYLCTAAGLTVCVLVILMFGEELLRLRLRNIVAAMFVVAVVLLASGMLAFLRETRIAAGSLHVREELLAMGEDPDG